MPKRVLYAATPEWEAFADRIDELINAQGFDQIKATARTRAGFFSHEGLEAFAKRVYSGGYLKGMIARVVGSRAQRALRGERILTEGGFRHPKPLLIMEERSFGSIRASYIVTEPLRAAQVLSAVAIGRRRPLKLRKDASEQVAREIRRLHNAGIYTRDMQETNLMIENRHGEFPLFFVDFEDFRQAGSVSMRQRMINLVHLDRSIGRFAPRAHRLRFFYNYFGHHLSREERRDLLMQYLTIRDRIDHGARTKETAQPTTAMTCENYRCANRVTTQQK